MSRLPPIFDEFFRASNRDGHEKARQENFDLRQDEIKLSESTLNEEQVSRRVNHGRITNGGETEKQRKKKHQNRYFHILLAQMRDELARLDEQLEQRYKILQKKYGDDVIGGMASTFLSETELGGLDTDKDKLQALANKFLDDNGNIKTEYQHLEEAKYMRDWQKAKKLRPLVEKYDGQTHFTKEELQDIKQAVKSLPQGDNENQIFLSTNKIVEGIIAEELEGDRQMQAQHDNGVSPNYIRGIKSSLMNFVCRLSAANNITNITRGILDIPRPK